MKIELVKSPLLSGTYATIYDVVVDDGDVLFERFVSENINEHRAEIKKYLGQTSNDWSCNRSKNQLFQRK